MDDYLERIGKLADKADNFIAATNLPMPAKFHLEQLKAGLQEISDELKAIHKDVTGVDLWAIGEQS